MRLFVAIEVPDAVRRRVAERTVPLRARLPRARWTKVDGLHLTLAFLGDTPEELVGPLDAALRGAFRGEPFRLRLAGAGTFPPGRAARVAWLGFEPEPRLLALQRRVAAAVSEATGAAPDRRPYHPHLTLARCRPPWRRSAAESFVRELEGERFGEVPVTEGVLVRSHLERDGARYETLHRYPLEADG